MARSRRSLPTGKEVFAGTTVWTIAVTASAVLNLLLDGWATPSKVRIVAAIFAGGGALAFAPALFTARLLSLGRGSEVAFAACFTSLLVATIGFTAALFGLQYLRYYSDWHESIVTPVGLREFVFTIAVGVYQFIILGIRLYFPLGFVALVLASLWFARQTR